MYNLVNRNFKELINMKKKVYAYLHTHWDREWYKELEDFRVRLVEVFDDVIEKLKKNEIPSFYFDGQTSALEDYLEIKPQNKEIIEQFIKEKRLFIGPYYCSTDSFLVDCESLIKNLQIGLDYSKKFGCKDFIAYHADTFGHSAHIPQIIKHFGIENAIFWRGLGELDADFLFNNLKSTYLIEGYFHDYFSADVSYEQKAQMLKRTLDRISKYSSGHLLLPLGADHLALPDKINEQIKEINKILDEYEIILTTPFEYLKKVKENYKKNIKKEFRDTKRNFILPGVLSSRIDLKQANAKCQWLVSRIVQPMQAIATFCEKSNNYQNNINYLHKKLIENHAHDSIYGCSIDNVHSLNKMRYKEVTQGLNAILNCTKRDLYEEAKYSIINLSNYDFNGAINFKTTTKLPKEFNAQLVSKTKGFPLTRFYRTNETPITEDYTDIYEYLVDTKKVKALSTLPLSINNINNASTIKITTKSIENDKLQLTVKNNKIQITDKINNKIYKDFISFIDRADIGDSYNFGALKNDKPIVAKILKTKIKEQGHIRSILEIIFELNIPTYSNTNARSKKTQKHYLNLQAILENQNDYIEFITQWENKSLDHLLQIEFNLKTPITETESDDLCGYIKRKFNPDYDIYEHIPAERGIELKHNTAPLQKCLLTQGVGIITEGLQEYEVSRNKLRLTILRATGTISNPHNPTRGTPAGPPIPTPDLQMLGNNTARFAISLKKSIKDLQPNVEKFYGATILSQSNLKETTIFSTGNKNVIISTIKTNTNNDLIIRLLNKSNKAEQIKFETTMNYKKLQELDATEQIKKEFAPLIKANSFKTIILKN